VRIDQVYRGIVLKPEAGNVYLLLWVDRHDEAYQWAQNRIFGIHPETGSLQIVEVTTETTGIASPANFEKKGLFDNYRDEELLRVGIPNVLLPQVRNLTTETQLDETGKSFPQEAFEALFMLAAGFTLAEVLSEQERQAAAKPVDTTDFVTALNVPDSQRRFHIVDDASELAEILSHGVIGGRPPFDLRASGTLPKDRQLDSCFYRPQQDLARTSQFAELAEEKSDRLRDALVRIDDDPTQFIPTITGRQSEAQLAAPRLRVPCRKSPLTQQAQLVL
jgi:hypothetical protein